MSQAQKELHGAGAIIIAKSLHEVLNAFLGIWEYGGYSQTGESRKSYTRLYEMYLAARPEEDDQ